MFDRNDGRRIRNEIRLKMSADRVLRWFRSCPHCGSIWPPIDLFCEKCYQCLCFLKNTSDEARQPGYPFPVYSVFNWSEQNKLIIGRFVHAFKRGWCAATARCFAECMLHAFPLGGGPKQICFPYSKSAPSDHAWLLAHSIAVAGGPLFEPPIPLMREVKRDRAGKRFFSGHKGVTQKRKSASDRSMIRFESVRSDGVEKFSNATSSIIFVDDVITTGASAMAAYMALGSPKSFSVWVLASRPKLAGKTRI